MINVYILYLNQGSPNYGRRAACRPQELIMWPTMILAELTLIKYYVILIFVLDKNQVLVTRTSISVQVSLVFCYKNEISTFTHQLKVASNDPQHCYFWSNAARELKSLEAPDLNDEVRRQFVWYKSLMWLEIGLIGLDWNQG